MFESEIEQEEIPKHEVSKHPTRIVYDRELLLALNFNCDTASAEILQFNRFLEEQTIELEDNDSCILQPIGVVDNDPD